MKITLPELSLVVLIGASGSGKSTLARQHFLPTEIISSDYCRGLVSDDENNQAATADAFELLHFIVAKRLAAGKLTVIDATNVQPESRKPLLELARKYHCISAAIVLNLPEKLCADRNQQRPNRNFGSHVVRRHVQNLKRSLRNLDREGFRYVYILRTPEEIDAVEVARQPLWNNRKSDRGPFDIIGDIHGCCGELEQLLQQLGYQIVEKTSESGFWDFPTYAHPEGRKAVFLGDLVDRGPRILDTLKLARNMVAAETALCVPGNHDIKLLKKLNGKNVKINHGLEQTLAEIAALPDESRESAETEIRQFLDSLIGHYVLDGGKLVVAHAGMKAEFQGRASRRIRDFALYGETTGEIDEFGLPVRYNWAAEYRGTAAVVYGHTPVSETEWFNNTVDIDTGCVFGGKLTALRYPEREFVSVAAARVYCEPVKPIALTAVTTPLTAQQQSDDILDIADVLGKRIISTRLQNNITIKAENAIAALEVMSRFAANPKWLIYLPPTMSPVATSKEPGLLEHPAEAFSYYQQQGISTVVCEEKHMGSRAVVIVCRDESAAKRRFGILNNSIGICYTRTGRHFFNNSSREAEFLARINVALTASNFWDKFQSDWVCLDCELMPWSAKAQELLQQQYATVGTASNTAFADAIKNLEQASQRGVEVSDLLSRYQERSQLAHQYVKAYQRYCWPVKSISDLKLAPFHILATEGKVHTDKNHCWHMEQIAEICQADPELLLATEYKVVEIADSDSQSAGIKWWEKLTDAGGEGMVVKPMEFIVKNSNKLVQPAVKCRGKEYLRIIYGLEYSLPEHLEKLRSRGLSGKRSLALREFALGVESLERFVAGAPLRQVHECVFGVLAMESEPVDPRL
ncbi:polynucleotide kinase-phosphatase [Tychonema sp. LEGE 07199]|uniref:polynucleotide kinase-phosphatase n=1 Tax=unclassified Tychonema TaxID=2642144 RepID=UPI00187FBC54|nr:MULTISPECIES: polynucleotide kinase-phosphatase [unclassified Tychonema]MBE9121324.1 polynucleotide kinase-phosphatase [Tychonema sp. LEGE 07199]MBE9134235.1 polynucleotide kinase-phosphatase [Tychonema sp. LEGE 07196]